MNRCFLVLQLALLPFMAACMEPQGVDDAEAGQRAENRAGSSGDGAAVQPEWLGPLPEIAGEAGVKEEPSGPISMDPGMENLVNWARQDLAARLAIRQEGIELLEASYVTWRDSSIGCPRPGMEYMQVLTNGTRIRLRAGGKTYHYHSGENRPPALCANPSPIDPAPYEFGET